MVRTTRLCLALVMISASGCAHGSARDTASLGLVAVGAFAVIAGTLEAAGCEPAPSGAVGCSYDHNEPDIAGGAAAIGVGTAMIAAGLAIKPVHTPPFYRLPGPLPARGPYR